MPALLRTFVAAVLFEGKIDLLKKKHPDFAQQIDVLASQIKPKYLDWAVKELVAGAKINDLVPTISSFEKNIQRLEKKDINAYTSKELEDKIKDIGKSNKQKRNDAKANGAEKIFENDQYVLLYIKTKEASICYGAGTKWCITMQDESYWEQYYEDNIVMYFAIDKTQPPSEPLHKIAIAAHRTDKGQVGVEIFDALDEPISADDYDGIPFLHELVSIAMKDAKKRPENPSMRSGSVSDEEFLKWFYKQDGDLQRSDILRGTFHTRYLLALLNSSENPSTDFVRTIAKRARDIHTDGDYDTTKEDEELAKKVLDLAFELKPNSDEIALWAAKYGSTESVRKLKDHHDERVRAAVVQKLNVPDTEEQLTKEFAKEFWSADYVRKLLANLYDQIVNDKYAQEGLSDDETTYANYEKYEAAYKDRLEAEKKLVKHLSIKQIFNTLIDMEPDERFQYTIYNKDDDDNYRPTPVAKRGDKRSDVDWWIKDYEELAG